MDNPTIEIPFDKGAADARIYFIPLFVMINVLILGSFFTFKDLGKQHKAQWLMFLILATSQTLKNIFFDATVKTVNDYVSLAAVLFYIFYTLLKSKK